MTKPTDPPSKTSTRTRPLIPEEGQVLNSGGGYSHQLDDWDRLRRYLVLGTKGGTYYATENELTRENAAVVLRCLEADGPRTIDALVEVSVSGHAPKNDPALFALALAAGLGNDVTRAEALAALPRVARTGTHLFQFVDFVQHFRGWGRGLQRAVGRWYQDKDPDHLAYQMVKYRKRVGFSHRDVLRLAKPRPTDEAHDRLYAWATRGAYSPELPRIVEGFQKVQTAANAVEAATLIRDYRLPREAVPPQFLKNPAVWDALLEDMPMAAMIRNLVNMAKTGLLVPGSEASATVAARLGEGERLRKTRIHPLGVLVALSIYKNGHYDPQRIQDSPSVWKPVAAVVDALDSAFYATFQGLVPSNKRFVLAVDVSESMLRPLYHLPGVSCRDGAGTMALVTAAREPSCEVMAFSDTLIPLNFTPRMRLDDALERLYRTDWGPTDCAQPMIWAQKAKVEADVFVVYTDSETWCGEVHASQALRAYRQATGIAAKLIVVGLTATGFTIADPEDQGMLDVVGFDTRAPRVMSDFARGGPPPD